ncbi:ABC transporter ATP-binding protein [Vallitalea sp. AN17-2]|uniref:ABC transporter ATP-binding protein n=2 Tax=Vallitalea maricola TaxID=3074433 RepID=A0ACB5UF49_9FIRM|nr:ABC transporter ATP-binding protein [Vallitalea sp. AN17-2]
MQVAKGEFVSILGASGSGKSTLMNIIGCMDTLDTGSYIIDDICVENSDTSILATIRNEKIGFIFQKYHLIPKYTVEQNVMMPLLIRGTERNIAKNSAKDILEMVGLSDRGQHKPSELSGGQQQRVAIARALITKPAILLADEPTGALDSKTGKEILALFKELNSQGNTIIQITHDTSVAKAGGRILTLVDGVLT